MVSDLSGMKLEISNKIKGKSTNIWKLNNIHLNNLWVKEEVSRENKKYVELNENENATYLNLWDVATTMPKRNV